MPLPMQAKLLRVLQEHEVRPVGARTPRPVDARVIAATNADLGALIAQRRFREDLYFRLDVVGVRVPPLRERPADIVPLAQCFLARAARHMKRVALGLSRGATTALRAYAWPGNVRELENAMEHAAALTDGAIVPRAALPDPVLGRATGVLGPGDETGADGDLTLAAVQRRHVTAVLARVGGNRVRAAALLGVAPSTLWRWTQRAAR